MPQERPYFLPVLYRTPGTKQALSVFAVNTNFVVSFSVKEAAKLYRRCCSSNFAPSVVPFPWTTAYKLFIASIRILAH
jgi:hypothetical protein